MAERAPARSTPSESLGPTFTERAIAAVPLPYPLACLLLAALAQSLGLYLANLADVGSLDLAWQRTFVGDAASPVWLVVFGVTFPIGFYTFLLFLVRSSRRALAASSRNIAPLLPDGEAGFRRIYGLLHARVPLLLLLLAAAFGAFFLAIGNVPRAPSPAFIVFIAVQLLVVAFAISTVLWTFFVTLWGLHRLGREKLLLRPYYEDPMRGLRPLGQMSVSATMVYFGAIALVLIPVLFAPQPPLYLAFLLVLVICGAMLFVLPLLGIHRRMAEEKKRILRSLAEQAARQFRPAEELSPISEISLANLRAAVLELRDSVALERAQRQVASLPTWPFDPEVTGRVAAITLTGVVAILGRAAVDVFLSAR